MNKSNRSIVSAITLAVVLHLILFSCVQCRSAEYVVACHANWCQPCKRMLPIENRLRNQGFEIRKVDVDQYPNWHHRCRVLPTFFYCVERDGRCYEVARIEGACSEQRLRSFCLRPITAEVLTSTGNWLENVGRWLGGR